MSHRSVAPWRLCCALDRGNLQKRTYLNIMFIYIDFKARNPTLNPYFFTKTKNK